MTLMSVFWILIPLFIGVLFIGLYRNLLVKLGVILGASGRFIPFRSVDAAALGQAYVDEVVLQRRIRLRGRVPWTRHMLISWGFSVLFGFDILTALFTNYLLLVVVTGFVAQAMHFANLSPDPSRAWALLGHWLGEAMRPGAPYGGSYSFFWMTHALAASAFLAYLGWSRMVHIFAAPLGRIFYAQPALREAKVRTVMEGLLKPRSG